MDFTCAICDLTLPDASGGTIVDLVQSFGVPVIVLTGLVDEAIHEQMHRKKVIDYVVKDTVQEIRYAAYLVARLCENSDIKVMVVDDSASFRSYLESLLLRYRFNTITAADGHEALERIAEHPDTTLVITDYNMPDMGGQELIQALRKTHSREELAIICVSSDDSAKLTARLLKAGANDFLRKPFEEEEFYCRVVQNTNLIGYVREIRESVVRDFLTGLYNRRHLFEVGASLPRNAVRGQLRLCAALIDADHFKKINDTHGHQVGDEALAAIARAMKESLREADVLARYGGEEFVCLGILNDGDRAEDIFERLRAAVAGIELEAEGVPVPLSVSIGVTTEPGNDLEDMLSRADSAVYEAKQRGRNRVVLEPAVASPASRSPGTH